MAGPREDYPLAFIRAGLRQELSGREMLRQFRSAGGRMRTISFQRLVAESRALRALRPVTTQAPLRRRPLASELGTLTTRHARGFRAELQFFVRQRGTDRVFSRPISIRSRQLRSYGAYIDEALAAVGALAEQSDQVIYGAEVIGVAEMIPETA